MLNFKKLINEAYDTSAKKGHWDRDYEIEELLFKIIEEVIEAKKAYEIGYTYEVGLKKMFLNYGSDCDINLHFQNYLKDTFEMEIADIFIIMFSICGHLKIPIDAIKFGFNKPLYEFDFSLTLNKLLFDFLHGFVSEIFFWSTNKPISDLGKCIGRVFYELYRICKSVNINIEKHIKEKMEYNKTRSYQHKDE